MPKALDLVGKKFNRLLVIKRAGTKNGKSLWECLCDCGETIQAIGNEIKSGHTKSCGCLRDEQNAGSGHIDGRMKTGAWKSWRAMKTRCLYPSSPHYKNYGGRGIKICERWMKFENFYKDMGERPDGLTIDRINVDGNYEPSNCRWVTWSEQQRNKRASKFGDEVSE